MTSSKLNSLSILFLAAAIILVASAQFALSKRLDKLEIRIERMEEILKQL